MEFHIIIRGRGGHGSRPDLSVNPLDCFAAAYAGLQQLGCRFTRVSCGKAGNVIEQSLEAWGSCPDPAGLERMLTHTCQAFQCVATVEAQNENPHL